ncbi:MAG TPA: DUF6440 family protein [Ruminiclostridium sp.]|nr:DUF6440 family protein [Ruminiclostridium sp.]
MDSEKRFEEVYVQKSFGKYEKILKDKDTGVCYLFVSEGYGGGLTVLVDRDGRPVTM